MLTYLVGIGKIGLSNLIGLGLLMLGSAKTKHSGRSSKTARLSKKAKYQLIGTGYIAFGVLCAVVGFVLLQPNSTPSNQLASLYVDPSSQKVRQGDTVTLEVWVNAKKQPINAVQANLTYPTSKFKFKNIDPNGSAFEVEAQSTEKNGLIKIGRGHIGKVSGTQLVAKVNLTALSNTGSAAVHFTDGSAVVRATDNTDILGSMAVEHLTLADLFNAHHH